MHVWTSHVRPRLSVGLVIEGPHGAKYQVSKIDDKSFTVTDGNGLTRRVGKTLIDQTAKRLLRGEHLPQQATRKEGGIGGGAASEAAVAWSLQGLLSESDGQFEMVDPPPVAHPAFPSLRMSRMLMAVCGSDELNGNGQPYNRLRNPVAAFRMLHPSIGDFFVVSLNSQGSDRPSLSERFEYGTKELWLMFPIPRRAASRWCSALARR